MAEFAVAEDGHNWNNALAHATYQDNVREHGRKRALELLRADIRSWIRERRGEPHQWSLTVRDGQMVTETGVSLQTMTDNITHGPHSDLVPEAIKATAPMEAATLEEATRLAVAGADRIVLPEQHLSEKGEVVARYLSVWTKDASDPTLYHGSRIDLGENKRIEDVRTGTAFAAFQDGQALSFHEHKEQKRAFVLAVQNDPKRPFEAVKESITTAVLRSHQETYAATRSLETYAKEETTQHKVFGKRETVIAADALRPHDTDLFIQAPGAVMRETVETVRGIALYWRKRQEGREKQEEQPERLTIAKIREEPVSVREFIEKRHKAMKRDAAAIAFIVQTGVAVHAAPAIFARLAEKPPRLITTVEKSIRRHRRKELRRKKYELKREAKRQVKTERKKRRKERIDKNTAAAEKLSMRMQEKRKRLRRRRRRVEIGVKKIAAARKITPMALETRGLTKESEKRERRKRLRVGKKKRAGEMIDKNKAAAEKLSTSVLRKLEKTKQRRVLLASKGTSFRGRQKEGVLGERMVVTGVRFSWLLWMLLKGEHGLKRSRLAKQDEALETRLRRKAEQSTPWVMLSIIWYLVALHEQAILNPTNPTNNPIRPMKNQKRSKKRRCSISAWLPQQGIIFAFQS